MKKSILVKRGNHVRKWKLIKEQDGNSKVDNYSNCSKILQMSYRGGRRISDLHDGIIQINLKNRERIKEI